MHQASDQTRLIYKSFSFRELILIYENERVRIECVKIQEYVPPKKLISNREKKKDDDQGVLEW